MDFEMRLRLKIKLNVVDEKGDTYYFVVERDADSWCCFKLTNGRGKIFESMLFSEGDLDQISQGLVKFWKVLAAEEEADF